jgi:hypothetical protein
MGKPMNNIQKAIIIVALMSFVLMGLFPPWHGPRVNQYGLIFSPPSTSAVIDISRLVVQWLLLIFTAMTIFVILRKRDRRHLHTTKKGDLLSEKPTDPFKHISSNLTENAADKVEAGNNEAAVRKKERTQEEALTNLDYRPKWGYRILLFFGIYIFLYVFAALTLKLHFSAILMTTGVGIFLIVGHLLIFNKRMKNMFPAKHRQYGFLALIYFYFMCYGMFQYKETESNLTSFIQYDTTFTQLHENALNNYYMMHPDVETISNTEYEIIMRELLDRSPKFFSLSEQLWIYKVVWYSSSWPFYLFIVAFLLNWIGFRVKKQKLLKRTINLKEGGNMNKVLDHGRLAIALLAIFVLITTIRLVFVTEYSIGFIQILIGAFCLLIFIFAFSGWLHDRLKKYVSIEEKDEIH